jgi:D-tyrosyl-tRNA(Tyr) deacylase
VVVQRASDAAVTVDGAVVGHLPRPGLLVLLGVTHDDTAATAAQLAVSQFTLYADTRKGRRPSWSNAAPGAAAEPLVDAFATALRDRGAHVETGRFGAHMLVSLVNDGPVTVILEA